MKISFRSRILLLVAAMTFGLSLWSAIERMERAEGYEEEAEETGEAERAFQWWYGQRAVPNDAIPAGAFTRALTQYRKTFHDPSSKFFRAQGVNSAQWESLGPNNVGGRVLSLALDPAHPNILWAGSASGGLWKSTVRGLGASAWTYVNTGFPSLSVSAIAINPSNPDIMLIGTGELSFYQRALIGIRGARASYGMGILRSTDGGVTWDTTTIKWAFSQLTAVNRIAFNPLNPSTVFAATSEGTFRSDDGGATWTLSLSELLGIDVVINPVDTGTVYVSCGNYNSTPNPGLYKSTNGGTTWTKLGGGLPTSNFGRTALALVPSSPSTIYAGIADASTQGMKGLYKSTDNGATWTLQASINYVRDQGWYNNVVGVDPFNANNIFTAGIDIYKSTNGGPNLSAITSWGAGYFVVPIGGPEGPGNYSHADHHAIVFDPTNNGTVYVGNDGGVFATTNGGTTWTGRNGGFVTSQFYPGFAVSRQDSDLALGGLQDNGTLRYNGNTQWDKVYYGDGGWCAINQQNDLTMYAEYTYLTIARSVNGGSSFSGLPIGNEGNFIAPFAVAPSNGNVLYAGGSRVYKSSDGGSSWVTAGSASFYNGTNVSAIAVSWSSADTVLGATGSGGVGEVPSFSVKVSTNGGNTWTNVTAGLPNRYPTDLEFDPKNGTTGCVSYSGYGAPHIWRTTNLGASWTDISSNLPDIPAQSVAIDPDEQTIYLGTDLGVYRTTDLGASWEEFNNGMPVAMIHDLVFTPANRTLRAATHGHGVWQMHLSRHPQLQLSAPVAAQILVAGDPDTIRWTQSFATTLRIEFSPDGGTTWTMIGAGVPAPAGLLRWTVPNSVTTTALIRLTDETYDTLSTTGAPFTIQAAPDMERGWNILSIHAVTAEQLKTALFPTALSEAFAFNGTYIARDSLLPGEGFWLKFSGRENFGFTGTPVDSVAIPLVEGWNLIGAIGTPVAAADIIEDPPGVAASSFFGYKSNYFAADTLYPKHGYWVKASGAGTITLKSGPHAASSITRNTAALDGHRVFGTLTFSTLDGWSRTLTLLADQPAREKLSRVQLPPAPPAGANDARFTGEGLFASALASWLPLAVQSPQPFMMLQWKLSADLTGSSTQYVLKSGDRVIAELNGDGTAVVGMPAEQLRIERMGTSAAPSRFSLEQNYPNPFNPSTKIRFSMATPGRGLLELFAMNGARVATVADGVFVSGEHTVEFNAANLSSGIYYYRLTTAAGVITRKMALIR